MKIVGGLWAVVAVAVVSIVIFLFKASQKGWLRWHLCTASTLSGSLLGRPIMLMWYRIVIACYSTGVLVWLLARPHGELGLYFYTVWNFMLLTLFFICAAVHSFYAWQVNFKTNSSAIDATWFNKMTFIMFQIVVTTVFLVDVVLWGVLYTHAKQESEKDHDSSECCAKFINFGSFNVHGFNFLFMMIELALNAIPVVPSHSIFVVIWAFTYMFYSWILYAAGGHWDYFFQDTSSEYSPLWYAGLFVAHLGFFFLAYGCYRLKMYFLKASEYGCHMVHNMSRNDSDDELRESEYLLSTNASVA